MVKNLPANAGDMGNLGSIPGPEISLAGGNGNPLQYSARKIPWTERGLAGYSPWDAKESDMTEHTHTHTHTHTHIHTPLLTSMQTHNFIPR